MPILCGITGACITPGSRVRVMFIAKQAASNKNYQSYKTITAPVLCKFFAPNELFVEMDMISDETVLASAYLKNNIVYTNGEKVFRTDVNVNYTINDIITIIKNVDVYVEQNNASDIKEVQYDEVHLFVILDSVYQRMIVREEYSYSAKFSVPLAYDYHEKMYYDNLLEIELKQDLKESNPLSYQEMYSTAEKSYVRNFYITNCHKSFELIALAESLLSKESVWKIISELDFISEAMELHGIPYVPVRYIGCDPDNIKYTSFMTDMFKSVLESEVRPSVRGDLQYSTEIVHQEFWLDELIEFVAKNENTKTTLQFRRYMEQLFIENSNKNNFIEINCREHPAFFRYTRELIRHVDVRITVKIRC